MTLLNVDETHHVGHEQAEARGAEVESDYRSVPDAMATDMKNTLILVVLSIIDTIQRGLDNQCVLQQVCCGSA